jgi:hypothetical protein
MYFVTIWFGFAFTVLGVTSGMGRSAGIALWKGDLFGVAGEINALDAVFGHHVTGRPLVQAFSVVFWRDVGFSGYLFIRCAVAAVPCE